jgi:hypothetical protein
MSEISADAPRGSVFMGMVWMFIISLLLFWLPVFGGLIAGVVGGKAAGGVGRAITAVFLPGLLLAAALFVFATLLTGLPVIGAVAAMGGMVLAFAHVGPMLLGAIIGGLLA